MTIAYALTSAFADGQAEYTWKRDGDRYEITRHRRRPSGFFTLFLEGAVDQDERPRDPEGLRPERFSERRGSTPEEGLAFDWDARQVQFRRGDNNERTAPLTDNTVDWLSMIFQLAHMPPKGESMDLRVFTQRRLYKFRLAGGGHRGARAAPRAAPARCTCATPEPRPEETVDVWLGVGPALPAREAALPRRAQPARGRADRHLGHGALTCRRRLTRAQLDAIVHALTVGAAGAQPRRRRRSSTIFRDHRELGSRDRALVADTVYSVLRRRRLLEAVTPSATPRELALASLVKLQGVGIGQIEPLAASGEERDWLVGAQGAGHRRPAVRDPRGPARLGDRAAAQALRRTTRSSRSRAACSSPRRSTCA